MHLLSRNNSNLYLLHKTSQNDRLQQPFTQRMPDYKTHHQIVPSYNTEDPRVNTNMFIKQIYWNPCYTVVYVERLDCNEKQRHAPHKQLIILYVRQKKTRVLIIRHKGEAQVYLHSFLTSALEGGQW